MNKTLPLNIQFFAEEESVETQEVAEPVTAENEDVQPESETSEQTQEVAEPVQSQEENARYAAIRRKTEEEAKRKYDKIFAKTFGNHVNPITGKPIQGVDDYLEALSAQQQAQIEAQLKNNGFDTSILKQLIENNPTVRQAQQVMDQQKAEALDRQILNDIAEINKMNPKIKTHEDLANDDSFVAVYEKWQKCGGALSLAESYELVNRDTLTSKKLEAAKQAAINQAKGKSHLETTKGVTIPDNTVDIPASELPVWKEAYPELSMSQLREKYNKTL